MSLHKKAVLIQLNVSRWDGKVKDTSASLAAAQALGCDSDRLEVGKILIDKKMFSQIDKVANKIRNKHYEMTIPWRHNGVALLPTKMYWLYTETMQALKDDFSHAVDEFLVNYAMYRSDAKLALGNRYSESDYPSKDELRQRFAVSFTTYPIPAQGHFLIDLEKEEVDALKASLGEELNAAQDTAIARVWERVESVVRKTHETLSDPDKLFRDSLVDNVLTITELLPSLNILDHQGLKQIHKMMETSLCGYSAETLRYNTAVRAKAATAAGQILQYMTNQRNEHYGTSTSGSSGASRAP